MVHGNRCRNQFDRVIILLRCFQYLRMQDRNPDENCDYNCLNPVAQKKLVPRSAPLRKRRKQDRIVGLDRRHSQPATSGVLTPVVKKVSPVSKEVLGAPEGRVGTSVLLSRQCTTEANFHFSQTKLTSFYINRLRCKGEELDRLTD